MNSKSKADVLLTSKNIVTEKLTVFSIFNLSVYTFYLLTELDSMYTFMSTNDIAVSQFFSPFSKQKCKKTQRKVEDCLLLCTVQFFSTIFARRLRVFAFCKINNYNSNAIKALAVYRKINLRLQFHSENHASPSTLS